MDIHNVAKMDSENENVNVLEERSAEMDKMIDGEKETFMTWKSLLIMLLSFLCPMIVLILIYANHGITYDGDITILTFDLKAQYAPFVYSLRNILSDPSKIFFNWNYCYGGNFIGVFTYYLMSPLNLLTLFWKADEFYNAIYVLVILKVALCGLSFSILLKYKYKKDTWINIIFSTCYALMSYNIAYGMCIMWMDAVILLPIVVIGVELILEGKNGGVYFLAMTMVFFTNFYMSYFVGIFVAMYFLLNILASYQKNERGKYLKAIFLFGINTVLALGISSPFVLATLMNMKDRTDAWVTSQLADIYYQNSFLDIVKNFLPSSYKTLFGGGLPFVFAGSAIYVLFLVYFFQKREIKSKLVALFLLIFVVAGFFFRRIDWFWHGFKYPTGFSHRYAFLFSFLIILFAYNAYIHIYFTKPIFKTLICIICLYTLTELYMNGSVIIGSINEEIQYSTKLEYINYYQTCNEIADVVHADKEFSRISSVTEVYSINNNIMYDLNGAEFFSSTNNSDVSHFLQNIGNNMYEINLVVSSYAMTPLMDSLFNIKYRISPGIIFMPESYELVHQVASENNFQQYLYKNPTQIHLGVFTDNSLEMPEFCANPFDNQMLLLETLGIQKSNVFREMSYYYDVVPEEGETTFTYRFTTDSTDPVYFYMDALGGENDNVSISFDGDARYDTYAGLMKRIFYVGEFEPGEEHEIVIKGKLYNYQHFYLYSYDMEEGERELSQLKERQLQNVQTNGNRISFTVNADGDGTVFTTLPYDPGYKIYVDGKRAEYKEVLDTFIGIDVSAGSHYIELVFVPEGFVFGCIISALSLLGAISLYLLFRRKAGNNSDVIATA